MHTEKPEDQPPSKPNEPAPMPDEWQKPRTPSTEEDGTGTKALKGCGGIVLVIVVLFGLLFGTCLLSL